MRPRTAIVLDNRRPDFAHGGRTVTKLRPPLSIDGALGRIAGQLPGAWAEMAKLVDRHQSTVRRWGDHDAEEQIPLPAAIILDIAYQRAGGDGTPLFDTYALQVQVAKEQAFSSQLELARRACTLIKEGAEAEEAMVLASLPSATELDRVKAVRELEDVVRVATNAIAMILNRPAAQEAPS